MNGEKKLLIVAGSYTQAELYARQHDLPQFGWTYVDDARKLFGLSPGYEYVLVGSFIYNRMWPEIRRELGLRGCVERAA